MGSKCWAKSSYERKVLCWLMVSEVSIPLWQGQLCMGEGARGSSCPHGSQEAESVVQVRDRVDMVALVRQLVTYFHVGPTP